MAPIEDKMNESRLRQFGHIRRRLIETSVRLVDEMEKICSKRDRTTKENFRPDIRLMAYRGYDHKQKCWRSRISVVDPTQWDKGLQLLLG